MFNSFQESDLGDNSEDNFRYNLEDDANNSLDNSSNDSDDDSPSEEEGDTTLPDPGKIESGDVSIIITISRCKHHSELQHQFLFNSTLFTSIT